MNEEQADTAPVQADTAPVQNTETNTQPVKNEAPEFKIPDAYKDKGWASKVKSEEDLYKQIDNLSSLVGKKEIYKPADFNDDKAREEYYASIRPEKEEDYQIPEIFPEEERKAYQKLLYENGISKYQAEKVFSKLSEMRQQVFDGEDMTNTLKKSWGTKVEEKTKQTVTALKTMASKEDLAVFDMLPNQVLASVYRTVSNILDKYGAKESDIASSKAAAPQQVDVAAQRSDLLTKIQAENSRPNPDWAKLEQLKTQLSNTYKG
jgi:hypothetical protein